VPVNFEAFFYVFQQNIEEKIKIVTSADLVSEANLSGS
jgi:hypothetical protein